MSATLEKLPAPASRTNEILVDFEVERVKAPFFLRCGALLTDYIVVVLVPVTGLLLSRYMGNDGARLLGGSLNDAGWLLAVLIAFTNFIVLPVFTGQTIGKMLGGLRIVRLNGQPASTGSILLRQLLGYALTIASLGIGFLISVLGSKGRALHDYIAGTVVIYADRQPRKLV